MWFEGNQRKPRHLLSDKLTKASGGKTSRASDFGYVAFGEAAVSQTWQFRRLSNSQEAS